MDKIPASFIFFGLLMGAILGVGIGSIRGSAVRGLELGSLAGLFVGWFIAATVQQQRNKKD